MYGNNAVGVLEIQFILSGIARSPQAGEQQAHARRAGAAGGGDTGRETQRAIGKFGWKRIASGGHLSRTPANSYG